MRKYRKITVRKQFFSSGMTVIELLVTLLIFSMLTTVLFSIFGAARSIWYSALNRSLEFEELMIISRNMISDLRDSNISSIVNCTVANPACPSGGAAGFTFLSAYNSAGNFVTDPVNGSFVWQKHVTYCIQPGTTNLLRSEGAVSLAISDRFNNCAASGKIVARSLSFMQMTANFSNRSVLLSFTVQNKNSLGKTEELYQNMAVFMKN